MKKFIDKDKSLIKSEDIFELLNQLISALKAKEKTHLAEILDHRINKIAWTTSSEMFEEIRSILSKQLQTNEAELSESLKDQMNDLLRTMPSGEIL
jgi:hypothetical protein